MVEYVDAKGAINLDAVLDPKSAAHPREVQPEWIDDLRDAHPSIETAFIRTHWALPYPQVELEVRNSRSDDTGWHRLEYAGGWGYADDHPPAGVVAAREFLESSVDAAAFEQWWRENA